MSRVLWLLLLFDLIDARVHVQRVGDWSIRTYTPVWTHAFTMATQPRHQSPWWAAWVLDHNALTAFPQPCLNLVTSAAPQWLRGQWAAACEPAGLPRTQRWGRQPLTSATATEKKKKKKIERKDTTSVASSVNGPEPAIYWAWLRHQKSIEHESIVHTYRWPLCHTSRH